MIPKKKPYTFVSYKCKFKKLGWIEFGGIFNSLDEFKEKMKKGTIVFNDTVVKWKILEHKEQK